MADQQNTAQSNDEIAFLLTWDGAIWRDVVRLRHGQVTTIGRSATNRIVLQDDACSRNHCEVFHSGGEWRVRDLGSRNGTNINAHPVSGDTTIESGDVIGIGDCRLAFTTNLESTQFTPPDLATPTDQVTSATATAVDVVQEPSILHRTAMPEFLSTGNGQRTDANYASELAKLYRLGLEMGAAKTSQQLTEVVLANLARNSGKHLRDTSRQPGRLGQTSSGRSSGRGVRQPQRSAVPTRLRQFVSSRLIKAGGDSGT